MTNYNTQVKWETTKAKLGSFECVTYNAKNDSLELSFTLYGDYVNSSVERSNHYVFESMLEDENNILHGLNETIITCESLGYGAFQWIVKDEYGSIVYDQLKELIDICEAIVQYPVLDDIHYANQNQEDYYENWTEWQADDLFKSISNDKLGGEIKLGELEYSDHLTWQQVLLHSIEANGCQEVNCISYYDIPLNFNNQRDIETLTAIREAFTTNVEYVLNSFKTAGKMPDIADLLFYQELEVVSM